MLHELQVPWLSLYQGVDGPDVLALTLGVLGAFINGLIFPAFSLVFGEVRHSRVYHPFLPGAFWPPSADSPTLGSFIAFSVVVVVVGSRYLTRPPHTSCAVQLVDALAGGNVKDEIRSVTLWFTYLGCATLVAHFFETAMFMWSGLLPPPVHTLFCYCIGMCQGSRAHFMHRHRVQYETICLARMHGIPCRVAMFCDTQLPSLVRNKLLPRHCIVTEHLVQVLALRRSFAKSTCAPLCTRTSRTMTLS